MNRWWQCVLMATVLLIGLKLAGVTTWGWGVSLSPLLLAAGLFLFAHAIDFGISLYRTFTETPEQAKRRKEEEFRQQLRRQMGLDL